MPEEEKIIRFPLDMILEPSVAVRTSITLEVLQDLSKSIVEVGVIQPIVVKKQGDKYEITDGHRRFLASKMLGKADIPCIVRNYGAAKSELVMLQANCFREDVNAIDEAKWFERLHVKHGYGFIEIARLVSRSENYVHSRLQLLSADPAIQEALAGGQIKVSQAKEILKSPSEQVRLELLRVTIQNGATVSALRTIRADYDYRAGLISKATAEQISEGPSSAPQEYKLSCPCCKIIVGVNDIWPLSVCKGCYNGILAGVEESQQQNPGG